jgi:signal transduction histidine kinase/CheY-like chemotaxis protein
MQPEAVRAGTLSPEGRAAMKPSDNIADAVYSEQIAAVYWQMPIALGANFVNAALTVAVLTPIAARLAPLLWFGVVVLVTVGRAVAWRQYRRGNAGADAGRWAFPAILGAMFAGLCWGLGGAVLFPFIQPLDQAFLTMVIAGMCAGSVVLSGPHLPTLLAFLLPACIPMAARFFAEGTPTDRALGAMVVVFVAAMIFAGRLLNRIFVEAMRLRFELNEANLRLQAEISEHRATGAALRQSQKLEAIGHLTGGIAHDFNNLLTVVIGNLTLARGRAGGNGAIAPLLDGAMQAAERGVAQIQRLLGFARRQRLDPRSVDLDHLVAGIRTLLLQTLGPRINLLIAADAGLAPAYVDANQLELAILNLAINARDAMPTGGSLRIGLENRDLHRGSPPEPTSGEYVVLSMTDTGTGMDEATLTQVFDPFFTTKEPGSGSGLGLPTVQGFAAQSGGAVLIRSKPGAGTTVELWLPKADQSPHGTLAPEQSGSQMARGAAHILLCDDDDDVRRFIGEFLDSAGYTIHEANGPEEALGILEQSAEIDLLIVDYAMPGMNGLETIRQARKRRPGLRPLLITGYAGAVGGGTVGIPLLRKPFAPAELARRVAEILAI